jgi:beta-lactamase regulating signal transducer with metallopeptidase domain
MPSRSLSLARIIRWHGVLTPRVAVSEGLVEGVSDDELRAVLEHEHYHVCNLDPLKAVLAQTLSAAFFFLPGLELCAPAISRAGSSTTTAER